ncbi:hypothetical protein RAS1_26880 [Phycisphaerae bacterium RAS1]|nr:hypothetical protein RAS1_26880 [Phycisphaerae bacterium RAS1]
MRTRVSRVLTTGVLVASICGCANIGGGVPGSGVSRTETRAVGAFEQVEVSASARLIVTIGPAGPLQITGDDNLLPLVTTTVENGRLTIKPSEPIRPDVPLIIKVSTPALRNAAGHGATTLDLTGLTGEAFEVECSGASSVKAAGQVKSLAIRLSGASSAVLDALQAAEVAVAISGAGTATVHATEKLSVDLSGASTVVYSGDPKVEKKLSGVCTVVKKK